MKRFGEYIILSVFFFVGGVLLFSSLISDKDTDLDRYEARIIYDVQDMTIPASVGARKEGFTAIFYVDVNACTPCIGEIAEYTNLISSEYNERIRPIILVQPTSRDVMNADKFLRLMERYAPTELVQRRAGELYLNNFQKRLYILQSGTPLIARRLYNSESTTMQEKRYFLEKALSLRESI